MIALAPSGAAENHRRPTPLSRDLPGVVMGQMVAALLPFISIIAVVSFFVMVRFDLGHWPVQASPMDENGHLRHDAAGELVFVGDPDPKVYGLVYDLTGFAFSLPFLAIPFVFIQTLVSVGILMRLRRWRDSLTFWVFLTILPYSFIVISAYFSLGFPDIFYWYMD